MKETFLVTMNGIEKTSLEAANLIIYREASDEDQEDFISKYNLLQNIFDFWDIPTLTPHIEYFYNEQLGSTLIFAIANLDNPGAASSSESRLESHTFIYSQKQLFWFINKEQSNLSSSLFENYQQHIDSLESIIMYAGLLSYLNFIKELKKQKNVIDDLNNQADQKTTRKTLVDIADTERNLVILEHTIDAQESAFSSLLNNNQFIQRLNNANLLYDIKWYNRQVKKLVHVYRDLLDTVSSLYSDIMSNTLNILMKFLSSLSLILASSNLIAGIWGMNTGGLPFASSNYGTFIMIIIIFITGFLMFLFFANKLSIWSLPF